jgi:hypothetical protein
MGISFDQDMRIAGYRPAVFKEALRGFTRTRSPGNVIDLKSIFPLRRDGAIVFEECLDRGLIDSKGESGLSEKGEAIARGKAKRRTARAKAQALLDDFLYRIDKLNQDPDGIRYVEQAWLFGSTLRKEDTVGDIDIALVTDRRPEYRANHDARKKHLDELLSRYDDAPATQPIYWSAETWITNRSLYGAKRHPLLAGVQDGTDDLAALGVPCEKKGGVARGCLDCLLATCRCRFRRRQPGHWCPIRQGQRLWHWPVPIR